MKILCVQYDTAKQECNIRQFANVRRALDALEEICPLLFVCDIQPEEYGLNMCRSIKGDPRAAGVPIIVHVPGRDMEAQAQYMQAGADLVLSDPLSAPEQGSLVANLLSRYDQLRNTRAESLQICHGHTVHDKDLMLIDQLGVIIQEHISDPALTPTFIATQMNIALRTLYRRLKAICNTPLTDIILEKRLEHTRQLLIQTHLSIKEICYMSGFNNHCTFYKQFTAKFGCTPRRYREMMEGQDKEHPKNV